ncbi:MAG: hypothetical protein DME21_07955, partial [Verrucomicrobia bacterium]
MGAPTPLRRKGKQRAVSFPHRNGVRRSVSRASIKSVFDPARQKIYLPAVESSSANPPDVEHAPPVPLPFRQLDAIGRTIIRFIQTAQGLIAFTLITLGVAVTKFNASSRLIHPLIRSQIYRAGLHLLPMISFLACAL